MSATEEPMEMISIRLPIVLIEDLKLIASVRGVKYQTMMRQMVADSAYAMLRDIVRIGLASQPDTEKK